ncbi:O-antigen ligase family protein [Halalkalibacterium halodurans]|uniref:O-antigen ligase family protein n=2 Tax=Halalkalibacterium halodurans TaxID=86665 RepID=UPI002E1C2FAF|nr:O-antigen ligase family protein [Halalkalibacterium halodurans]MED4083725.1 O-antigen ligase family protein [Halalkalibacterium halodurans]MED4106586.1 O-antigen ligase family protein [Halalkalibacterium halodurans]MED4109566.1 O-antigen ligase family protein [Halalkalibacterium halodurans]MED4151170.1 O-antigen ligase family protein [Halalkalibacterium halodurans]
MEMKNINNSIYILLFCTLFFNLSLEYGTQTVPYFALLAIQILTIILYLNKINLPVNNKNIFFITIVFLAMLWYSITSLYSGFTELSISRLFMSFVPGFFLLLFILSDKAPLKTFINVSKGLMYSGVFLSIVGLVVYLLGEKTTIDGEIVQQISLGSITISQLTVKANDFYRISSLTGNPNNLGFLLFITVMLTFTLLSLKQISKFKFIVFFSIQSLALLMTFSRSSLLSLALGLLIFYIFTAKNIHSFVKRLFTLGLMFVFGIFLFNYIDDRITGFDRSSGLAGREVSWEFAINLFRETPILGAGFGISQELLNQVGIYISTHNTHLNMLLETGLIGYVLFILIWLFCIVVSLICLVRLRSTPYQESKDKITIYSTIVALLVSIFINQLFETKIPYVGVQSLMWFYFLGAALIVIKQRVEVKA